MTEPPCWAAVSYAKHRRKGKNKTMLLKILAVGKMLEPKEARLCAAALVGQKAPEWRQAGLALLGLCEERDGAYTAAIETYRNRPPENADTEDLAAAALRLGKLEFRAGEFERAETTLKRAVSLNSANADARADAYVMMARSAGARKDWQTARAYATVVLSLFEGRPACAELGKFIGEHPEMKEAE